MTTVRRVFLAASLLLPAAAWAQPEGRGQGNRGQGSQGNQGDRGNQGGRGNPGGQGNQGRGGPPPNLGTPEIGAIQRWLGVNPGFAAQPLPPGMRNRLAQGKPLPPGIARRAVPNDLLGLLPVRPGYEYAIVGASLVLVSVATGVVASILSDALLR